MLGKRSTLLGLLSVALAMPVVARADEKAESVESIKLENERLSKELGAQEKRMRELQSELDQARSSVVQAKFQIDALERRCKKLQDDLAAVRTGRESGDRNETEKNSLASRTKPRPNLVQGKITAVGKDSRLIQISVGVDAGAKEGQVLEVFRLAPPNGGQRTLYLGTLTLIRVDPQASLGQFQSLTGFDYRPIVGDDVSSELFVK